MIQQITKGDRIMYHDTWMDKWVPAIVTRVYRSKKGEWPQIDLVWWWSGIALYMYGVNSTRYRMVKNK